MGKGAKEVYGASSSSSSSSMDNESGVLVLYVNGMLITYVK